MFGVASAVAAVAAGSLPAHPATEERNRGMSAGAVEDVQMELNYLGNSSPNSSNHN